ncbi:PocR ligand-binding domain-containing protein [Vallitalea pronyensis]|uniref:PocR ligand-binding domain-containing protein n=1 Tax=Vallitalea pronyensis TaxID=1348613 RepID=A0A8J8SHJ2_9FIRM|nr:PocR ligand-binding domain-containing protein [Vallitalea pronyensis]QUI23487.1 PocR ligand-binding domain-containing protein [Vallitalea pronyensis]
MKVMFDNQGVQDLLDDYQRIVGVRIAVYDLDYREVYKSPKEISTFCQLMRKNSRIDHACRKCDVKAFSHVKKTKEIYPYQCHMGLTEVVAPILDDDVIVGYIMVGQILNQSNVEKQWDYITKKSKFMGADITKLKSQFLALRQLDNHDIQAITKIMQACASYIWLKNLVHVERAPLSEKIRLYVEQNMSEKISTDSICAHLGVGKTSIYQCVKQNYGVSLMQYIRHIRIQEAKKLLTTTDGLIGEIAEVVGYDDYNYFSKDFKKITNMSPRVYRKTKDTGRSML